MRSSRFWLYYLLLAAVQILLCNSLHITQLLTLWFLPMMVLCIPIRYDTLAVLPIAFATGMAVDFLTQGVPGLCTVALLPVAFSRNLIIRIVFGGEVFSRGEDISIRRQGILKMTLAILTATALFLLIYLWADGSFTRPFWFNGTRYFLSLACGTLVSVLLVNFLSPEEGSIWK